MKSRILLLVTLCAASCYAAERDHVEVSDADPAQERLIALYSTFSLTRVSTTTTTVSYTCHTTPTTATACKRRRRKRSPRANTDTIQLASPDMVAPELSSSKDVGRIDTSDATGKLFFTIWTTSFTTVTLTEMSTNYSVTLQLELSCTASGQSLLPNC